MNAADHAHIAVQHDAMATNYLSAGFATAWWQWRKRDRLFGLAHAHVRIAQRHRDLIADVKKSSALTHAEDWPTPNPQEGHES